MAKLSLRDNLYDFLLSQGVAPADAKRAADRCARAVTKGAVGGFTAGVLAGLATSNPGALLMGVVGGAAGGAITLTASPSCQQVRDAARQLAQEDMFSTSY